MPVKTWVMLESKDFLANERIYMPLKLEGPSSGGILHIRADLLSSPTPVIETQTTTTTTTVTTDVEAPVTTITTTIPATRVTGGAVTDTTGAYGGMFSQFFRSLSKFASPDLSYQSVFNIWIGHANVLVLSERYSSSFDVAVPINFFLETVLLETAQEPLLGSGSGDDLTETTFGNSLVLGDYGSFPSVSFDTTDTPVQKLMAGYHPCFLEVISKGNTWRIHVEIEYDYDRTGDAEMSTDFPIISNILLNKSSKGYARISWETDLKADRNWVDYGISGIGENMVEASMGSLYPNAILPMTDGSYYEVQVHSTLKDKTTNSSVFNWKMPEEYITGTTDLTPQARSEGGLIGDGQLVQEVGSTQEIMTRLPQLPIIPMVIVGGVALVGLGGLSWFLLRKKG